MQLVCETKSCNEQKISSSSLPCHISSAVELSECELSNLLVTHLMYNFIL